MKKFVLLASALSLLLVLCACNKTETPETPNEDVTPVQEETIPEREPVEADPENPLVGVWEGDGTMDIMGLDHDIEFVNVWTIRSDGTATAEKEIDGETQTLDYSYKYTEDTLTFENDNGSCAISYTLDGDTLSIRTGVSTYATFVRQ